MQWNNMLIVKIEKLGEEMMKIFDSSKTMFLLKYCWELSQIPS